MTPEEFKQKMMSILHGDVESSGYADAEVTHSEADKLMCDVLRQLGYGEGVEIFECMDKWYA